MLIVYKKIQKGVDPVLGEIRNQRFQRRRKKLSIKHKFPKQEPFLILGDTGRLSIFKFSLTIKQDVRIEIAHTFDRYAITFNLGIERFLDGSLVSENLASTSM